MKDLAMETVILDYQDLVKLTQQRLDSLRGIFREISEQAVEELESGNHYAAETAALVTKELCESIQLAAHVAELLAELKTRPYARISNLPLDGKQETENKEVEPDCHCGHGYMVHNSETSYCAYCNCLEYNPKTYRRCQCGHDENAHMPDDVCNNCQCVHYNPVGYSRPGWYYHGDEYFFLSKEGVSPSGSSQIHGPFVCFYDAMADNRTHNTVDLVIRNYQWTCNTCGETYTLYNQYDYVKCPNCGAEYKTKVVQDEAQHNLDRPIASGQNGQSSSHAYRRNAERCHEPCREDGLCGPGLPE